MDNPSAGSANSAADAAAASGRPAAGAAARLSLGQFLLIACLVAVATMAAMVALPHDKFLRYESLSDRNVPTAYWIYQRIHDDPHPIDIAFVGTSHTGMAVHSKRLEERLAERGVHVKAANLHIVRPGVNMQYVVAKELLENRPVKLLVLEIDDWEERKGHQEFIYLADSGDVISAPIIPNLNFFADLARLPGRQAELFLKTQLQALGWYQPAFVAPPYEGPNLDHAEFIRELTTGGKVVWRSITRSPAEMEVFRKELSAKINPPLLPPRLAEFEYRMSRDYTRRILDLAKAHGTQVVFLYLPRYGGPPTPAPYALYADRARLINPWTQMQGSDEWIDGDHVNWPGAQRVTDYLAGALVDGGYVH